MNIDEAVEMAVDVLAKQNPRIPIEIFTGNEWICECHAENVTG